MRKVVSGGQPNRTAPQKPFRPFGYNLVELSRFAVSAFPLVFQSPAQLALGGLWSTLNHFGASFALILPSRRAFHNHS
jgi:hypothetical protein